MKKHFPTIMLILIMGIGLSLLLYPSVSNYWNSVHQSKAIVTYAEQVADLDKEEYEKLWKSAEEYNQKIADEGIIWQMSDAQEKEYNSQLKVTDSGIMSYIEIPKINCALPIYHGTDDAILQTAVGHLAGTSLPVGGESTHCVLSGHRGLPSAKLFTNLDKLVVSDTFIIRTLDEVLTYEVDQILVVLPDELDALQIVEGKDLCTLVTCTPYGINTHRLLVRGHRIPNEDTSVRATADALQIDTNIASAMIAVPILLILIVWLFIIKRKKKV